MIKSILNIIKKDLGSQMDLKEIENMDMFSLHFGVCRYIRNKYLWKNDFITKILSAYFDTNDIDDLSYKILEEILKE